VRGVIHLQTRFNHNFSGLGVFFVFEASREKCQSKLEDLNMNNKPLIDGWKLRSGETDKKDKK